MSIEMTLKGTSPIGVILRYKTSVSCLNNMGVWFNPIRPRVHTGHSRKYKLASMVVEKLLTIDLASPRHLPGPGPEAEGLSCQSESEDDLLALHQLLDECGRYLEENEAGGEIHSPFEHSLLAFIYTVSGSLVHVGLVTFSVNFYWSVPLAWAGWQLQSSA